MASSLGQPTAALTLAGYGRADLDAGRLQIGFGEAGPGAPYMHISTLG
jgi:hypothetical protein